MSRAAALDEGRPPEVQVIVADCGIDAAWVRNGEGDVLVVNPGQTFGNAVSAVARAAPHLHPDQVRTLVRHHLPNRDLDLDQVLPGYNDRWLYETAEASERSAPWLLLTFAVLATLAALLMIAYSVTHTA